MTADRTPGWVAVGGAAGDAISVEVSPSLAGSEAQVLARVRHAFDLDTDPDAVSRALAGLADVRPGVRVPHAFDGFELAVRAILGQQVSVRGASTLAGRFATAFGDPIATPFAGVSRLAPTAERIAGRDGAEIAAIGMPRSRAASILALARAVRDGRVVLDGSCDPADVIAALVDLPGIGDWTAQYVAMRALGWSDAFPASDLGIRKALGGARPREAIARAEAWRPYRAYAVMQLWRSLGVSTESPSGG